MELEKRLEYFKHEFKLIARKYVKDFVKACINDAPDYVFEDCPSSSSGKYHPIEELGPDGTLLHTRKVVAAAYDYTRALDCEQNRDLVVAAAILHDLAKQGLITKGHTVKEHPQIMAELMRSVYERGFVDKIPQQDFAVMYNAVFFHYGLWTDKRYVKPMYQYSPEELCVYLSDYIVSKRFIEVKLVK